jgi:hypothetical protein
MTPHMTTSRERLRAQASSHDSQFATAQARACGITPATLLGMRRRGEIEARRYGVWRFTAAAANPDAAVTAMLACGPDAVISHASAARFHGLARVPAPTVPEVTVPHGEVRKRAGISIHWSRDLTAADIITVGGIRYTTLARTVVDLADADKPWDTLSTVDDAIALGASRSWIHNRASTLTNGRGGVRLVRDATHPDAAGVFRSYLERVSAHVYRLGCLPDPEWNVALRDEEGLIGIVDALWQPWAVVSETEGLRFHTSPAVRKRDARRFNRLRDAHYDPRRFSWEDVVKDPVGVVTTLHRALRASGADLDPARIPRSIDIPARPFV